jgi:peptidoglycan hydrolase-like protein with peptidoglycan-binding domain
MPVDGPLNTRINAIGDQAAPMMTMMPQFDTALLAQIQIGQAEAAVDAAPVLAGAVAGVGHAATATDGSAWFVPALELGRRDRTSRVPMVAFSRTAAGWQVRVGLDRLRGDAPANASLLPVTGYAVKLVSTLPGFVPPTFTVTFESSPRPDAVDRLVATANVDVESTVKAMRSPGTFLQVSATAHYRTPAPVPTPPPPPPPDPVGPAPHPINIHRLPPGVFWPGQRGRPIRRLGKRRVGFANVAAAPQALAATNMNFRAEALTERNLDLLKYIDFQRTPDPTVTEVPVNWPPISFQFDPTAIAYYRPIYAGLPGIDAGDDGTVWAPTVNGYWRAAQTYSVYNVVPDEYRLAYDVATNTPAMTVLLRELPAAPGGAAQAGYAVRVRFRIVPWIDPQRRIALQAAIAAQEYAPHPALVIGGYQGASFDMTSFLSGLGADTVSAADSIDPNGFELVWDCTLEFYTFLCSQLAPRTPSDATAVEGRVKLKLRTSGEDAAAPTTVDVPVRLSLDTIAGELVSTSLLPLPADTLWPDGWSPALYATVVPRTARPMDTRIVGGSLIILGADGQATSAIPLTAAPPDLTLNGVGSTAPPSPSPAPAPAVAPPPPPPATIHKRPGVVSEDVRRVQKRLHDVGFDVVVDGDFGDQTEGVLRDYQDHAGLPATGVIDAATWLVLFTAAPPPAFPGIIKKNPHVKSPDVRTVQQRLRELGFDVVVDGEFGDQTEDILREYQAGARIASTGVIDAATWQALFAQKSPPQWPPAVPSGSALVRLDPAVADAIADPRLIGAAELVFGRTDLHIDRVQTLERIHTLAAASPLTTSVTVSSYQLAHPDNLPSAHPRIFALDTEIRRGQSPSVRVTITREAPSAAASIPFSFDDIVAGLRPDQPRFDYRVRYEDPDGPGPWTEWTQFVGRELRVTPSG